MPIQHLPSAEESAALLRSRGLRVTAGRVAAIAYVSRHPHSSAAEIHAASLGRSDWHRYVAGLFETYDFLILPSAQVFPFEAEIDWPKAVDGRAMDTYHRWMEVVIGPTMAGLPVAAMPAGFGANGLPAGIQIIGPPRGDRKVLEAASAYEARIDWLKREPILTI